MASSSWNLPVSGRCDSKGNNCHAKCPHHAVDSYGWWILSLREYFLVNFRLQWPFFPSHCPDRTCHGVHPERGERKPPHSMRQCEKGLTIYPRVKKVISAQFGHLHFFQMANMSLPQTGTNVHATPACQTRAKQLTNRSTSSGSHLDCPRSSYFHRGLGHALPAGFTINSGQH